MSIVRKRFGEDSESRVGRRIWDNRLSRREMLHTTLGVTAAMAGAGTLLEKRTSTVLASAPPRAPVITSPSSPQENIVVAWGSAALQAIRDTRPGPPMVARDLAIVHTAIYDAWAAYDSVAVGTRLGAALRQPPSERTEANKAKALSYAACRALADLFPSEIDSVMSLMSSLGYDPGDTAINANSPSGIGNLAAQAVIDFRHGDGSNQLGDLHPGAYSDYTGYAPVNGPDTIKDPNRWQPLRVSDGHGGSVVQRYIGPHWGLVTPFALRSGSQFRPVVGPRRYPSAGYRKQALQMLQYSANLTDRQKVIAEYWADGPSSELPPGHWCLFAHFVSARDKHDLDADVKLLFAVTNAVLDAGIAIWEAKRAYDSVRPVTAIHFLYKGKKVKAWGGPGQGTIIINGEDWQPYQAPTVVTPPFAEYVSGHSGFSAAGAEILKRFTGSDACGWSHTQPAGSSKFEPGLVPATDITLSWKTFTDAANQAGMSRRYGGIHFPDGDVRGRAMGRLVGAQVWNRTQAYITGRV